ncbi:MAG TPA: hypothetical protein DDY98_04310 [Ruminococcaceae bacterium]|nr:hypothetical protein [Oscillospiraceae bacterium]
MKFCLNNSAFLTFLLVFFFSIASEKSEIKYFLEKRATFCGDFRRCGISEIEKFRSVCYNVRYY